MTERRRWHHGLLGKDIVTYTDPRNLNLAWKQLLDPDSITATPHSLGHHINNMVAGLAAMGNDPGYLDMVNYSQSYLRSAFANPGNTRMPNSSKVAELAVRWNNELERKLASFDEFVRYPRPNDLHMLLSLGMGPVIDELRRAGGIGLAKVAQNRQVWPCPSTNTNPISKRFHPQLFEKLQEYAKLKVAPNEHGTLYMAQPTGTAFFFPSKLSPKCKL